MMMMKTKRGEVDAVGAMVEDGEVAAAVAVAVAAAVRSAG